MTPNKLQCFDDLPCVFTFFIPATFYTLNVLKNFVNVFYVKNIHGKFHPKFQEALLKPQKRINRPRFYLTMAVWRAALTHYVSLQSVVCGTLGTGSMYCDTATVTSCSR